MREAEVSVSETAFEAMGVDELVSLTREAGHRTVEELACHGNGAVVQVEVESRLDEDRLTALDCVDKWNHVAARDDSHVYVISFTAPDLPETLADTADDLVGTCDPEVDDSGATMSLVGPHAAIAGQLSEYERAGVSPQLRRIGRYEGPDHPLDELTARQREVIETAWELGYYEVPRAVSADEVAAALALDSSTVTEHLQRAERNLMGQFL
ncbi:helix-turn-helix domain-containing protein [Halorubellus sp. JP-L1]|uniref:helix-turn-helix domain-containing protein n=1 Tax=Halorubellus sp. JP-L1 TaxID=2715753 RepID=UPI00140B6854|nr:helix-turn-helix domain-containing protein [Halorubellus sp. JP-L1]NHN41288.1 helix-turn-helix domain-containing protein [Halorubellus sp. JP-L1]